MNALRDFYRRMTFPFIWWRLWCRRADVLCARVEHLTEVLEHRCTHDVVELIEAHIVKSKNDRDYGYKYLKVFGECQRCHEQWFLQGRTDGVHSSNPVDPVFYGNVKAK